MIARASTGKPWLFQELLNNQILNLGIDQRLSIFMQHLEGLRELDNEYQAVLQSKSLVRYYFKNELSDVYLQKFYLLRNFQSIYEFLNENLFNDVF